MTDENLRGLVPSNGISGTSGDFSDRNLVPSLGADGSVQWVDPNEVRQETPVVYRIGVINSSQTDLVDAMKDQIMVSLQKDYPNLDPEKDKALLLELMDKYPYGKLYMRAKFPNGLVSYVFLGAYLEAVPLSAPRFSRSLMPAYNPNAPSKGALCASSNSYRPDSFYFFVDEGGVIRHKNISDGQYLQQVRNPEDYKAFLPPKPVQVSFNYDTHSCISFHNGRQIPSCPFAQGQIQIGNDKPVKCDIQISLYLAVKVAMPEIGEEPVWVLAQVYFSKSSYMEGSGLVSAFKAQAALKTPVNYHIVVLGAQKVGAGYSLSASLKPNAAKKRFEALNLSDPEFCELETGVLQNLFNTVQTILQNLDNRAKEPVKPVMADLSPFSKQDVSSTPSSSPSDEAEELW